MHSFKIIYKAKVFGKILCWWSLLLLDKKKMLIRKSQTYLCSCLVLLFILFYFILFNLILFSFCRILLF